MIRPQPRTRRRLLSPGQRAEIARLVLEEGMSVRAVARQFDISWSAADYWVTKAARSGKLASKPKRSGKPQLPTVDISDSYQGVSDCTPPDASEQVADTPAACEKPADTRIDTSELAELPEASSPDYLVALLTELFDERDFLRALVRQIFGLAGQPETTSHDS